MTRPRKQLASIDDTPYYHIVSRCVRKSFLCGFDKQSGISYEHRRQWIENRIRILGSIFPLQICAYSVMSNHLHIVVKLCPEEADLWSRKETLERWTSLYKGPILVQRQQNGEALDLAESGAVNECIEVYRTRLKTLGWFMKALNEPIARQANKEDDCTGHFWEARYKSQALLTEEAVLTCMTYVDLNPIRACMAYTPESSDHTSIKERIQPRFDLATATTEQINLQCLNKFELPLRPLAHFDGDVTNESQNGILFSAKDYIELVDITGRIVRKGKRGAISAKSPPILQRLGIDLDAWVLRSCAFEKNYQKLYGKRRISYANSA
jgi:REP element-mobilizing transposase RayT